MSKKEQKTQMEYCQDHLTELKKGGKTLPSRKKVADALEVKKRVQHILFRRLGANSVDVGFRIVESDNRFTNELAIRMHVKNKLEGKKGKKRKRRKLMQIAAAEIERFTGVKAKECNDGAIRLFGQRRKGYRLDVIEARYIPSAVPRLEASEPRLNDSKLAQEDLLQLRRGTVRPLVGGISIGNSQGQAGTLGAVVWDRTDGTPCLLSNWHVLAGNPAAVLGNPCYQPALLDGGRKDTDLVGHFKRGFLDQHGDAALASITPGHAYCSSEVLGLWEPLAGSVEPRLGMPVRKWGRTTGFTRGFIDGIGFTTYIHFRKLGTQFFDDQIHIATRDKGAEVSDPGDSGALWVTKLEPRDPEEDERFEKKKRGRNEKIKKEKMRIYFAVGLNFAGDVPNTHSGEFAVASPVHDLAERLQFAFRPYFFPRRNLVFVGASQGAGIANIVDAVGDHPISRIPPGEPT